jgi:hypothetical protein
MIIRRGEKIEIAVGTRVEFTIGDGVIEGEKFDLTHTRFRVL